MESFPCPHGMGKAASCWECMEAGPVTPPVVEEPIKAEFWLNAAHYDGECGRCHGPIEVGEPIGKTEAFGWCCQKCAKP